MVEHLAKSAAHAEAARLLAVDSVHAWGKQLRRHIGQLLTLVGEEAKGPRRVHPPRQVLALIVHVKVDEGDHIAEDEAETQEGDLVLSARLERAGAKWEPKPVRGKHPGYTPPFLTELRTERTLSRRRCCRRVCRLRPAYSLRRSSKVLGQCGPASVTRDQRCRTQYAAQLRARSGDNEHRGAPSNTSTTHSIRSEGIWEEGDEPVPPRREYSA